MKEEWKQLLQTGAVLFARHGVTAISTEDISQCCGLTKRRFYEHFESKENLLNCIVTTWTEKMERYLLLNRQISANAIDELQNFLQATDKVVSATNSSFLLDLRKRYTPTWKTLLRFREETLGAYLQINISRGIKEEIYRSNADKAIVVQLYLTQLQLLLEELCVEGVPTKRVSREMNICFLQGLVNIKGMKLLDTW
ncbi:TetR/AcrR family transcriptional regulator [Chitinophaga sp. 212800010-3]|uniref:TetR/AcrR family transcriptional regulator n=1 Tax=unclassified Chitinophaga TaxID=2619133 RepID=UPI002DF42358|nr:hypothetical protein [Chitinophaga sp. 212800010-3]